MAKSGHRWVATELRRSSTKVTCPEETASRVAKARADTNGCRSASNCTAVPSRTRLVTPARKHRYAGASYSGYTSDLTRTLPVSGRFTPRQREIYDIVLGAQKAAIDAIKPGMTDPTASARKEPAHA